MKFIKGKKNMLTISVILIILGISFFVCKTSFNTTNKIILDEVKLKTLSDNTNAFAVMIGDTEGNYTKYESTTLPQKEDGYIFNPDKSLCVDQDGNKTKAEFKYRNNMVRAKVEEASLCYLYYDKISEGDFCIDRGITNLHDCLLVMEDYSYDTEEAIAYIEDKGSVTTTAAAPTMMFAEKYETMEDYDSSNGLGGSSGTLVMGKNYTFNTTSGNYTVKDTVTDYIGDNYINYYTCAAGGNVNCEKIYKILDYKIIAGTSTTKYIITKANVYSHSEVDSFDSEIGLYAADDEDGRTYFYRGAVKNNYVSYAGFIWRIVRINGDGSIRMIYSGTNTNATGIDATIGKSPFNNSQHDPRFIGYKYGEDTIERWTDEPGNVAFTQTAVYYFGENYIKLDNGHYQLDPNKNMISGTWSGTYEEVLEKYPYTCLSYSPDSQCKFIIKLTEYVNASTGKAYYKISDNSKDYQSTLTNEIDSTIKTKIDLWYEENIKDIEDANGMLLSNYLSDETFCNERGVSTGTGFMLYPRTYYNAYYTGYSSIVTKPSLICSQEEDKFSISNRTLKYPIGLLTADEARYAGIMGSFINYKNYLYINQEFWTITPGFTTQYAYVLSINTSGKMSYRTAAASLGVRPVINLSNKVKITEGIGTKEKPYVVTID